MTAPREFTHWDWFLGTTTVYRLVRETAKTVWGVPINDPTAEPRRFSKHRIHMIETVS